MKLKKNPKASLERFSKVFSLLGLVLTLFICHVLIEHKSYASTPKILDQPTFIEDEPETVFVLKKQPTINKAKQIVKKQPKKNTLKTDNSHQKVENNINIIDVPFEDSNEEIIDTLEETIYEPEIEEKGIETIPFVSVESVPLFPGCEKYKNNRVKAQKCFNKKVTKFFSKKFNLDVANKTDLNGLQKITCNFIIDDNGMVETDIKTSKTHPLIEKEIKSTLKKLPKMTPANQNGKSVKILYRLPVKFIID